MLDFWRSNAHLKTWITGLGRYRHCINISQPYPFLFPAKELENWVEGHTLGRNSSFSVFKQGARPGCAVEFDF